MTRAAPASPPVPKRGRLKLAPLPTFAEGVFQRALLDALKHVPGIRAWRQQTGITKVRGGYMHLAPNGAGDIVGTAAPDGLHFELEVKGPTTETQPAQDPWRDETIAAGAVYLRVRPDRGETLAVAVSRSVRELQGAIAEARGRRSEGDSP